MATARSLQPSNKPIFRFVPHCWMADLLSASSFALHPVLDWRSLQGIPALFVDKSGAWEQRNVDTPVTWRYCFRLPLNLGFAPENWGWSLKTE